MTVHLDLSVWELLLGCALFFFAAIGVVLVCFCILVDAFRISFPLPATAVDTDVVPEAAPPVPVVHVGEVVLAPRQDLLPPAPVSLAEVPIFADVPKAADCHAQTLPCRFDDLKANKYFRRRFLLRANNVVPHY